MGTGAQGKMTTHQQKKLDDDALLRVPRPLRAAALGRRRRRACASTSPADDSPEMKYLHARRQALGGYLPARVEQRGPARSPLAAPSRLSAAGPAGTVDDDGVRPLLSQLCWTRCSASASCRSSPTRRAPSACRPVPPGRHLLVGRPALRARGPRRAALLQGSGRRPDPRGRHHRGRRAASWIAAATGYIAHGVPMLPFYIFYSMFGFQRVGDLIWAAADSRARGFLLGATAGRTTLSGEGLQHQDGSSHLIARRFRTAAPTTRASATSWR